MISTTVTSTLDHVDETWDYVTTRKQDDTDGFIQYGSQRYPNVPGTFTPIRFQILEGDSHTGETASPGVAVRLRDALIQMGVEEVTP